MSAFTFFLCLVVAAFGSVHGATAKNEVKFYVLKQGDLTVNFTNFGARINSVSFPDKDGNLADIALGFDTVKQMLTDKFVVGAIVGRVTNRIGYAQFTMNGTHYKLPANEGRSYFNGGPKGYGYVLWKMAELKKSARSSHIVFTYKSYDGETGFPGDLDVRVKHTVQHKKIITEITAKAENKATPVNIGQHSVWNLAGHNKGSIMKHEVQIFGNKIIENSNKLLPTGKLIPVKGTGYDFLTPHILQNNAKRVKAAYAINYVLSGKGLKLASIVHEKKSGRILKFWTTAPTLHFCTSTKVKNVKGKGGAVYQPYSGFAFDGQEFPDAVNHKEFPSIILTKGKVFRRTNVYHFSVRP